MTPSTRKDAEAREQRRRAKLWSAKKTVHAAQQARRRRDNIIGITTAIAVVALATMITAAYLGAAVPETAASSAAAASTEAGATAPDPSLSEYRTWTGSMELNGAEIDFDLDGQDAPQAVASFVTLVQSGFYDGLSCHRLVDEDDFHILQCGDPNGDGSGGPEYQFGPIENAPSDDVYTSGTLAMARVSGDAYSQGSQFFIVFGDSTIPSDTVGGYTVFGTITGGLDSIQAIAAAGVQSGTETPVEPVTISTVTVE